MTKTLSATYLDAAFSLDIDTLAEGTKHGLMEQGFRIIVQRKNASNADFSEDDKRKEVTAVVKALVDGSYHFGGGGGGKSRDPFAKELRRLLDKQLEACGVKVKQRADYTVGSWAEEFCTAPVKALAALEFQARENVERDASFAIEMAPTITLDDKPQKADDEEE